MSRNPSISAVSTILGYGIPEAEKATRLFDQYTTRQDPQARNEFVAALIGELLVARARNPEEA